MAGSSRGSTTSCAPMTAASARRSVEKSAATIGSTPCRRSAAMTARPTGPQPSTSAALAGGDARPVHGVDAHGHRLGERGEAGVEPVGHLERQQVGQHHQLAVPAGVLVGVADRVHAGRVERDRHRHHHVAHPTVAGVGAQLDDLGGELVAHHHVAVEVHDVGGERGVGIGRRRLVAHLHHAVAVMQGVQVGAADAAGQGAHQHLACARYRIGDLVDHQPRPAHDRRSHGPTVTLRRGARRASPRQLAVAVAALQAGEAVVVPTDTVYGVAALPSVAGATQRLFALKQRGDDHPLAVLVADRAQALRLVEPPTDDVLALMARAWPGPLTVVLRRGPAARALELGGDDATIGLRCPAHDLLLELVRKVGPLATTSANRHGEPTPPTAAAAAAALSGPVAVVLDGGRCAGEPSTVVDCTVGPWRVLRVGAFGSSCANGGTSAFRSRPVVTTTRVGVALIAIGIVMLIAGALDWANPNLLDIAGVGLVVFGAVATCIGTEDRSD